VLLNLLYDKSLFHAIFLYTTTLLFYIFYNLKTSGVKSGAD
jgi:hypothetical protein